ncbi:hypothetical protein KI387_023411, partial [Taxus chinensis]
LEKLAWKQERGFQHIISTVDPPLLRDQHIIHLLITKNLQRVRIADFGVSRIVSQTIGSWCNSYVGTCAYMSPERFDPQSYGGSYNGYTGDIWSLGLTLLECYTEHFPFLVGGEEADWPALMCAICFGDLPSAPPNVVCKKTQAKDGRPRSFSTIHSSTNLFNATPEANDSREEDTRTSGDHQDHGRFSYHRNLPEFKSRNSDTFEKKRYRSSRERETDHLDRNGSGRNRT